MVSFKLVIGTKEGKCLQKDTQEAEAQVFLGKKIGDAISGDKIGFSGYEFVITGGSDYCGFPMRKDVDGLNRRRILAVQGVGLKMQNKGVKHRKTVCGNTIHPKIVQINLKVTTPGKDPLPFPVKDTENAQK